MTAGQKKIFQSMARVSLQKPAKCRDVQPEWAYESKGEDLSRDQAGSGHDTSRLVVGC